MRLSHLPRALPVGFFSPCLATLGLAVMGLACNRGPEPGSEPGSSSTAAMSAEPSAMQPSEMSAEASAMTPPGHPPVPSGAGGPTAGTPSVDRDNPALAGLRWEAQEPLSWRPPSRPMRNAEYAVGEGDAEAVLTVFHFRGMGGAIDDNVDRWVGQFRGPDGEARTRENAAVETKTVHGLEVTTVDVSGTFASTMAGGPPQGDQRMLGAIVAGPQGPVFFKLVGPAETVASAADAFAALVASFEPAE